MEQNTHSFYQCQWAAWLVSELQVYIGLSGSNYCSSGKIFWCNTQELKTIFIFPSTLTSLQVKNDNSISLPLKFAQIISFSKSVHAYCGYQRLCWQHILRTMSMTTIISSCVNIYTTLIHLSTCFSGWQQLVHYFPIEMCSRKQLFRLSNITVQLLIENCWNIWNEV